MNVTVRKRIAAPPDRVFDLWTRPELVRRWWGPDSVVCTAAEIDLRVGGGYRIANQFTDGNTVWIAGTFERIDSPHLLVYSWRLEPGGGDFERVTVRFEPAGDATDVTVIHERVASEEARRSHESGWIACLAKLQRAA
jgi:uncharacterized protein YndB with AHSA1/START domain